MEVFIGNKYNEHRFNGGFSLGRFYTSLAILNNNKKYKKNTMI